MSSQATEPSSEEISATISKTRADLYVFESLEQRQKWDDLLFEAQRDLVHGKNLEALEKQKRVQQVISNLWTRIFRWQKIQFRIACALSLIILLDILLILVFDILSFPGFDQVPRIAAYGILGATISVVGTLGRKLDVVGANRLGLIQTCLRPLLGLCNACLAYLILHSGVLQVGDQLSGPALTSLLYFAAGYSERLVLDRISSVWN